MPYLSIITVHYRDYVGLDLTMRSILKIEAMDYQVEWIIIDGGSSFDGVEDLKSSVIEVSDVFISEPDAGIYDAMNKGLRLAQGDFVIFMNAGDCFAEQFSMDALFDAKDIDRVSMVWCAAYEGNATDAQLKLPRDVNALWYGMPTHHQAMLFRTSIAKKWRYDTECTIAADYKLVCQMAYEEGCRVVINNLPVCIFDLSGVSSNRFWLGLSQQQIVRCEVLKIGVFSNAAIYILKASARLARLMLPKVYSILRYKK